MNISNEILCRDLIAVETDRIIGLNTAPTDSEKIIQEITELRGIRARPLFRT